MPSLRQMVRTWGLSLFGLTGASRAGDPVEAHYDRLERLYLNSGVYDDLANVNPETGVTVEGVVGTRSLRNPANRVTEFYAAKLNPAEWLETVEWADTATQSDNLETALRQLYTWSNWEREGRTASRQFAWAGDLFEKVSTKEDASGDPIAVYLERIDPRHVKDFDTDERGHLTYLRVSTPKTRRVDDEIESYTQTEIWDKELRTYRVFEHSELDDPENLSNPVLTQSLTAESAGAPDGFTGYDFIPVKHTKFRDIGQDRGLSCFGHALGLIRECDRIATKLHEMLFPDEDLVVKRDGVGPDGNPLPPIEIEDNRGLNPLDLPDGKLWARGYDRTTYASGDKVKVGTRRRTRLPAGASIDWVIPNRNLTPALEALDRQVATLERDMPEIVYGKLPELELSGRAIRYALAGLYDRFNEAHANLSAAIIGVEDMALTIGQVMGLEGFSSAEIGEYGESGEAFARIYPAPDPFPNSRQDEAEADLAEATALQAFREMGGAPYKKALIEAGYTEAEANAEVASASQAQEQSRTLGGLLGTPPIAGQIDAPDGLGN